LREKNIATDIEREILRNTFIEKLREIKRDIKRD